MLKGATDVTQLDGLVRYSRGVALSRLALVACFVILLAAFTPWRLAVLGVAELGLYFALFLVTELALRDPDPVRAHRRLALQSDALMFLLVSNASWLAIQIRLYDAPQMRVEAALLAICVLLFVALRVHLTRVSYLIGVIPPAVTLLWIAIDWDDPFRPHHYTFAMGLFVTAVLVVTALELRIPDVSRRRNPTTKEIAIRMKMSLDALRICCSTERYSWRAVGGRRNEASAKPES